MTDSPPTQPASADPTPVVVRAPDGARVMEIEWDDGHAGIYPHEYLRGYCPCARCQGHQGAIKFVTGGDLALVDLAEVGSYALRLAWGDGHDTGIYTFRYLRQLCACEGCLGTADPHHRTFGR